MGWWYGEDVIGNGKPGWNANCSSWEERSNRIVFRVQLHPNRLGRVLIKVLRSYAPTMGRVSVSLQAPHHGAHLKWLVDGYHDSPYSVAQFDIHDIPQFQMKFWEVELVLTLLPLSQNESGTRLAALDEKRREKLSATGVGCAGAWFKLLSVITC